ncbi:Kinetochore protein NDC80 homolog [Anthophora quadrimaculata]
MPGNSIERRSSTNPVRVHTLDKEDNSRKSQISKSKISISAADNSHIPRPRLRASSCDRTSIRASSLKATSKTPLRHGSTTPKTPLTNAVKSSGYFTIGSTNYIHGALPTGPRSLSADRASSLGVKGPRKDTRPLTDKIYQAQMLNKIDNYFIANHCSSMLNSNGSLKPITLKMFVEVSAYLVKMLDIKQNLTSANYVEELPKIAKKLHYPGIINKSWLKTANAMHSWSNVLGWISWLVQLCEIKEIALQTYNLENLPFMGNEKEAEINRKSFFSMIDFYNAWNDEKLDEEAQLVETYLQEIEEQQGINEETMNNAHAELQEEMDKLDVIEKNASNIDEEVKHLQEVLTSLKKDEEKQLSDIAAKEEYIKTINVETELVHADCKRMCEQIRVQNQQHDELVAIIKEQPMSKVERDKILVKCTEMQNYMHQFNEHLQDIQKELYTMNVKLALISTNLTKTILTYNKELFMHLGDDIGVDLEKLKMPEKTDLHSNIMEELNVKANLMNDLKELLKAQLVEKERSLELNSNELENLQEKLKILEDESNDIANKIKEKKDHMNKIKTNAKNEEAKLKEQIKNLQNDIKEIQDSMPNTQELSEEIKEATDKLDALQRRKTYIENSAKLFFDKFYEILGEHRNELHNILTRHSK